MECKSIIHPTALVLTNCRKWLRNGSQYLVKGLEIGDLFLDQSTGNVYELSRIEWQEDRYFYGYEVEEPWLEGTHYSWVPARHVVPYTLLDILFD